MELFKAQAAASSSSSNPQRDQDFVFLLKELDEAKYDRLSGIEAKYEQQEAYVSELESQVSACQDQLNEFWNKEDITKATGDRVQKGDRFPPPPDPHEQRRPTFFSMTKPHGIVCCGQAGTEEAKDSPRGSASGKRSRLTLLSSPLGPRLPSLGIGNWT